ncbi:hypothetical protein BBJ28_00001347 [Nothophytophthora sp. Chile5]|nr:hypothetical protein BBJ28_00001347 [Nothophytophthora sp. Chile5]
MLQGLEAPLLYIYAVLMAVNAFLVFYHVQFQWKRHALHHILKDAVVDATFAVAFPALILMYSFSVFHDDLNAVKIRQQFFPPRVFERKARNFVNPKDMDMFNTDFESLLIRSGWDIFLKLSFSLLSCLRWRKITLLLLQQQRQGLEGDPQVVTCKAVVPLDPDTSSSRPKSSVNRPSTRVRTLKRVFRPLVSLLFLSFGITCIVYTAIAVRISRAACSSYPECAQFSHLWVPGTSQELCECLAYVDRDLAPADYDDLPDVTQTLAKMAATGKLKTVQLVNRKVNGSLPDELQQCQDLRNFNAIDRVMIYTGVGAFPAWTSKTFTKLEYLYVSTAMQTVYFSYTDLVDLLVDSHIEGDSSDSNLMELPSDLFSAMASLHTMHLSQHANLAALPPLIGLSSLQSVYLGYLDSIRELPSLGELPNIQVVAFEALPQVRSLPNVALYQSSLDVVVMQNLPVCCSGFLFDGACNTTFPSCCEQTEAPSENGSSKDSPTSQLPSTCLRLPQDTDLLPTNATLAFLQQFASNTSNFCDAAQATCPTGIMLTKVKEDDVCAGTLYRECSSTTSGVGICFNPGMGRVKCEYSQVTIDMRKAEIAAGVSCDKEEEQWLGCK